MPANAANWQWVDADWNGGQWYIDTASVVKEYDVASVWVRWNPPNGYCWLERWKITKDRTLTVLQLVMYNQKRELVCSHPLEPWEYKTMSIPPDTMLEEIYNAIW